MELMARYDDNHFDLAIVDPPYAINRSGQNETFTKNKKHKRKYFEQKKWDNKIPSKNYFNELQRVSKNQIIWGANYFVKHLDKGTMGWIVWFKGQIGLTMSDCELAFSSFQKATRVVNINRVDLLKQNSIHPTEKPIRLYQWLLDNYAKKGDKILDTHLGSGSIAIACHNLGYDLTACELDTDYYNAAMKRLKQHQAQLRLI
jgi:site-specific DNA-methyltransferase (adenine-specific)|tara:strand:+ start:649 stop:1254 length:606 start_codon:yes stop_codon:yes gene_type:complete